MAWEFHYRWDGGTAQFQTILRYVERLAAVDPSPEEEQAWWRDTLTMLTAKGREMEGHPFVVASYPVYDVATLTRTAWMAQLPDLKRVPEVGTMAAHYGWHIHTRGVGGVWEEVSL